MIKRSGSPLPQSLGGGGGDGGLSGAVFGHRSGGGAEGKEIQDTHEDTYI